MRPLPGCFEADRWRRWCGGAVPLDVDGTTDVWRRIGIVNAIASPAVDTLYFAAASTDVRRMIMIGRADAWNRGRIVDCREHCLVLTARRSMPKGGYGRAGAGACVACYAPGRKRCGSFRCSVAYRHAPFGGANRDILYVTTSPFGAPDRRDHPDAGGFPRSRLLDFPEIGTASTAKRSSQLDRDAASTSSDDRMNPDARIGKKHHRSAISDVSRAAERGLQRAPGTSLRRASRSAFSRDG